MPLHLYPLRPSVPARTVPFNPHFRRAANSLSASFLLANCAAAPASKGTMLPDGSIKRYQSLLPKARRHRKAEHTARIALGRDARIDIVGFLPGDNGSLPQLGFEGYDVA
jgi:hypothetical protein